MSHVYDAQSAVLPPNRWTSLSNLSSGLGARTISPKSSSSSRYLLWIPLGLGHDVTACGKTWWGFGPVDTEKHSLGYVRESCLSSDQRLTVLLPDEISYDVCPASYVMFSVFAVGHADHNVS